MSGDEVPSSYQAAGADPEFEIERMADQAIFNGQPRQGEAMPLFPFLGRFLGLSYCAGVHS